MKKIICVFIALFAVLGCGFAQNKTVKGDDLSIVQSVDMTTLPHRTDDESAPIVYFTKDISAAGMLRLYEKLGWTPVGKTGVKISTGESAKTNYLRPALLKDTVQKVNGTIVECNTAYGGSRSTVALHKQVVKDRGFLDIAPFDLLDEKGSVAIPVEGAKHLVKGDFVGKNFKNYKSYLVISHFKGHAMGGFGGAIKNLSIGFGSGTSSKESGKLYIHSGGMKTKPPISWSIQGEYQINFLESMAEAAKGVCQYMNGGKNIAFINVINRLSVDCDCNGNPEEPDMHDMGIMASLDPLAIDQACIDMVYAAPDSAKLRERIETRSGLHTLESGA
ncbi:MAG: DUF362 domain-containing protein, partial [Spirochaetales bacterium]|nr:DUF362 domain-containing protein [Spirochaetales bacterium]